MTTHLPLYLSREGKELRRLFEMAYPACYEAMDASSYDAPNPVRPLDVCIMALEHATIARNFLVERGLLAPSEGAQ